MKLTDSFPLLELIQHLRFLPVWSWVNRWWGRYLSWNRLCLLYYIYLFVSYSSTLSAFVIIASCIHCCGRFVADEVSCIQNRCMPHIRIFFFTFQTEFNFEVNCSQTSNLSDKTIIWCSIYATACTRAQSTARAVRDIWARSEVLVRLPVHLTVNTNAVI